MHSRQIVSVVALAIAIAPGLAGAAPGPAEHHEGAGRSGSAVGGRTRPPKPEDSAAAESPFDERPGWRRDDPRTHLGLGVFVGGLWSATDQAFSERREGTPGLVWPVLELGGRAGVRVAGWVGVELEGVLGPTTSTDGQGATLWAARGHAFFSVPGLRWVPFLLAGGGVMGIVSEPLGDDQRPLLHAGVGVAVPITDRVSVRVDLRDGATPPRAPSDRDFVHHQEALLGLSFRLPQARPSTAVEREPRGGLGPTPRPGPTCATGPGSRAATCSPPDADGDDLPDGADRCPQRAGTAPYGCPAVDTDQDGLFDDTDRCPKEAGLPNDGCPPIDHDHDGQVEPADRCPQAAETVNHFQDGDGCPDEIPPSLTPWLGQVPGLVFAPRTDALRPESEASLIGLAEALASAPDVRVVVIGRGDDADDPAARAALAQLRAAAVRTWLVEGGIAADRIEIGVDSRGEPYGRADAAADAAPVGSVELRLAP